MGLLSEQWIPPRTGVNRIGSDETTLVIVTIGRRNAAPRVYLGRKGYILDVDLKNHTYEAKVS